MVGESRVLVGAAYTFGALVRDPVVADVRELAATPLVEASGGVLLAAEVVGEARLCVFVPVESAAPLGWRMAAQEMEVGLPLPTRLFTMSRLCAGSVMNGHSSPPVQPGHWS